MQHFNCWFKSTCKIAEKEDCNTACIKYAEVNYLFESSEIPKKRSIILDIPRVDESAYKQLLELDLKEFAENGKNLYICSSQVGNGKTSWSMKLLQRYISKIALGNGFRDRCLFLHTPTFLSKIKDFNNEKLEEYKFKLTKLDLIVWDDLGLKLSEYDIQQLLNIIDARLVSGKANIFTSNKTEAEDLEDSIGARLTSRIYNTSKIIELKSKDKRGAKK